MSSYKEDIMKIPMISDEEVKELVSRSKNGDKEARKKLITSKMYLIESVLNNYSHNVNYRDLITDSTYDDLISDCSVALIQASTSYNPNNKHYLNFDLYAIVRMRNYLNRRLNERRRILNNERHIPIIEIQKDPSEKIDNCLSLEQDMDVALNDMEKDVLASQYEVLGYAYKSNKDLSLKYQKHHQSISFIRDNALNKMNKYLKKAEDEKKELILSPLLNYLDGYTDVQVINAIKRLATMNKEYYQILMNAYQDGFSKETVAKDFTPKYMLENKVVKEIEKIIKQSSKKTNNNLQKTLDEPFEFNDFIIASSLLFSYALEGCNDTIKSVIMLKYKSCLSEEEIARRLFISVGEVNDAIMNYLISYKGMINECFEEDNEIIYRKDFVSSKLFAAILSKLSIMQKYKQVIYLKFNGYTNDYIINTLQIDEILMNNLLNSFMQLYKDKINFYLDDYMHLELKEANNFLKR